MPTLRVPTAGNGRSMTLLCWRASLRRLIALRHSSILSRRTRIPNIKSIFGRGGAGRGSLCRTTSWADCIINMFEFEFPTGTRIKCLEFEERDAREA